MGSVFVLGAGASASAGVPIIRDFKTVAAAVRRRHSSTWPIAGRRLFDRALDRWRVDHLNIDIEELYVLADLLDQLSGPGGFHSLQTDVVYLIGRTIQHSTRPSRLVAHERFLRTECSRDARTRPVLITPNWDTVVEQAASRIPGCRLNYGYANARSLAGQPLPRSGRAIGCLKIHGSYNWLSCVNCQSLFVLDDMQYVMTVLEGRGQIECPHCSYDHCRPTVVPPLSEKFSGTPGTLMILGEVWRRAARALAVCSSLTIIGYSFPVTDVQFKLLLLDSLAQNKRVERVAIVTRPKSRRHRHEFESRCRTVFGKAGISSILRFEYASFENWVQAE